jgi:hypothetical protein
MFIRKHVKELAKDLVDNYNTWVFDTRLISNGKTSLWHAYTIEFYPEIPRLKFNFFEKCVLSRAIKKCMILNGCISKNSKVNYE